MDTDNSSDWDIETILLVPDSQVQARETDPDVCPNIDGRQNTVPDGLEIGQNGDCRGILYPLRLSEVMPNATGSDTGKEFIEIRNFSDQTVDLTPYELFIGQALEKSFSFPAGSIVLPNAYAAFTNAQMGFSLLNTSDLVQLQGYGELLDNMPSYQDPDEDTSWALIDGTWQYTNQLTPGFENLPDSDSINETKVADVSSVLKPCGANQYRSPDTNRCRNIASAAASTQTPCKDNQYRSEETNRCRNVATTDSGPASCKEGQERNPDTNRCRTIKAMPVTDYGVLGATTNKNGETGYIWLAIGGILALALAYTIWEWRYEIGKLFGRLRGFVRIRK